GIQRAFHRSEAGEFEGQSQDLTGVTGFDDPVVPEPGRRVVRVALGFVLVADGLFEAVFEQPIRDQYEAQGNPYYSTARMGCLKLSSSSALQDWPQRTKTASN